jgi:hypothetical protein
MANLAIHSAAPAPSFPSQGTIIDRAGYEVDATGWVWKLNHAVDRVRLDFRKLEFRSTAMLEAVAKFIAEQIKVSSGDNVHNTFQALRYLCRSEHFREADAGGGDVGERLISDLRHLQNFAHYRLHYIRTGRDRSADSGAKDTRQRDRPRRPDAGSREGRVRRARVHRDHNEVAATQP